MIEDYFQDEVVHKPFLSFDWKNRKTFDTSITRDCRWMGRVERIIDPDNGTEITSTNQVVLAGDVAITTKDEFTHNGRNYRVGEIREQSDFEVAKKTVVLIHA